MRKLIPTLALFAFACTTTQPAGSPQLAQAQNPPPCNPGQTIVNATVWVQSAAEYRASALQTYATARRMLDAAIADPSWHAEEGTSDPSQPLAIILDADETAIDNSRFEARMIKLGKTYEAEAWKQWVNESGAGAVPGAQEFLAHAQSRGVTPFFITNRDAEEEPGTRRNFEKLGFPLEPSVDTVLLRGEKAEWKTSDKGPRRAHVAASYRVLLLLGDDLNDFTNARDKSRAERDAIIDRSASLWGTRWFMLPNPVYGSWERAIVGSGGTPCEEVQKKIDALEE